MTWSVAHPGKLKNIKLNKHHKFTYYYRRVTWSVAHPGTLKNIKLNKQHKFTYYYRRVTWSVAHLGTLKNINKHNKFTNYYWRVTWSVAHPETLKNIILIPSVCNAHFHWLWRRKFAAIKSKRLRHESSDDVTSLATRRSNVTKTFWKSVLSEWIRMVITRFVFEWFAGINCIILRSQIPVLPLRWRVAVKLNLRP